MSVSSHLTPEPERRLWLILDAMRRAVEWSDLRVAVLTAFAAVELALFLPTVGASPAGRFFGACLAAALPLGVLAFSPLTATPRRVPGLDPVREKPRGGDCLVAPDDLAKYSHGELIHRLDEYLGGGITATQYYEDLVGQIVVHARLATRKRRAFVALCVAVGAAQLGLLAALAHP